MSFKITAGIRITLAAILSLITAFFSIIFPPNAPIDAESLELTFSVISDTHLAARLSDDDKWEILRAGLNDMAQAEVRNDALVIAGDLVEVGTPESFDTFYSVIERYGEADNFIFAMGNHDLGGDYATTHAAFIEHQSKYVEGMDEVYYYSVVKGCYFIVLGSEDHSAGCEAYLSPEQLEWFGNVLAEAVASGKPVFIVCHQPMNHTNRIAEAWSPGILGDQSDALYAEIKKYDSLADIFFISGHLHSGFNFSGITDDGTIHYVDVPSFGQAPARGSYTETGAGYQVEVYDDQIVFRARNFVKGRWLPQFDRAIDI